VARYLRQQGELGGPDVFLSELNRQEALFLTAVPDGGRESAPISSHYKALRSEALSCRSCTLAETRTNVVFSDGNPQARLMVVGEAPGAHEDKTGLAFVGPAGRLLDLLLAAIDLSRDSSAYICNVLKCRPPGNRNPLPEEIQECTPFLRRQIELISPEAILAVGTFSAQFLTGKALPLGRLRGEVYSYQGVPLVVTYHPAALLRNAGWTPATWDDFQLLRQIMDGA
jgi:DNA polymerase